MTTPVVPYTILLLQKLAEWDALLQGSKNKVACGESVLQMLSVFRRRTEWSHDPTFDPLLQSTSVKSAVHFFFVYPSFRDEWQRMGLIRPQKAKALTKRLQPQPVRENHRTSNPLRVQPTPITPIVKLPTRPPRRSAKANTDIVQTKPQVSEPYIVVKLPPPSPAQDLKPHPKPLQTPPDVPGPSTAPATVKTPKLSLMQVRFLATRTTVDILAERGLHCALFGSMACKLYGNPRIPNDIDVLVLPTPSSQHTQESLKELLVALAPTQFYLRAARKPDATYRVLWFNAMPNAKLIRAHTCKVDILLPGVMHLPALPPHAISWRMGKAASDGWFPVLPFAALLAQKLQSWDDHLCAAEARYKGKAPADVLDLEWLLGVGLHHVGKDGGVGLEWVNEEFVRLTHKRVAAFCEVYPKWAWVWQYMGFEVPE
ncbi:hypothetical protein H0H81_010088 [Sphagnurus paluster]|uniref:Uncharacterized protein n=1 Tax=Sphagnurus paluster TaxID=117069 RepID=A0A9P7FR86_9AGAR|nr:hypothetical protein H0H81_010088 [Sphagnurus paluster]